MVRSFQVALEVGWESQLPRSDALESLELPKSRALGSPLIQLDPTLSRQHTSSSQMEVAGKERTPSP